MDRTNIPAFPVYIFDVDGTLLDSAADICGAVRQVVSPRTSKSLDDQYLQKFIGWHLDVFFLDVLPQSSREQLDEMIAEYRTAYLSRNHAGTKMYPGVAEMLAALPGRKSTGTTKGTKTTHAVLELFGILSYFDHVQGTDGFPCKPAPDVLLRSVDALGVRPEDCLFIGDSAADMEAGRNAGIKTCAVLWGYGKEEDLAKWSPAYTISRPQDLIPFHTLCEISDL